MLKCILPLKVEEIVKLAIEKNYQYKASLTDVTHDRGVDVIREKEDAGDLGIRLK